MLLKQCVSVIPGEESHPPVAPLPPPPAPHLDPPLALLLAHAVPDMAGGAGMGGGHGPDRGQDDDPDLTLGVEEGTEGPDPGGDVTGHHRGQMTESERGTETGTGTGDVTQHADDQGTTPFYLLTDMYLRHTQKLAELSFCFLSGPVQTLGRGAVGGEGVGAAEATDEERATAAVPLSPPVVQTTVPPLTEEPRPLPLLSVTS